MQDLTLTGILTGVFLGAIIGFLFCLWTKRSSLTLLRDRLDEQASALQLKEDEARVLVAEIGDLRTASALAQKEVEDLSNRLKERDEFVKMAEKSLSDSFAQVSAQTLKSAQNQFFQLAKETFSQDRVLSQSELDQRKQAVESMVKPLSESLEHIKKYVSDVETKREGAYAAIQEQIKNMRDAQEGVRQEAQKLTRVLAKPTGRGQWGELQLQRVLEMAGMREHYDFVTQVHEQTDAGAKRPDVRVNLPGGRFIYIDSKAPMEAYMKALQTDNEVERETYLKEYAKTVRGHITALKGKEYALHHSEAPDFVVLFLPGEAFFQAALEADVDLIQFSVENNIIMATPTTLMALLKAVAYGWQQEQLAQNARKISQQATVFLKNCATLNDHFNKLRRALQKGVDTFNDTVGSFERSVLNSAQRLERMGVSTSKPLEEASIIETHPRALTKFESINKDSPEETEGVLTEKLS